MTPLDLTFSHPLTRSVSQSISQSVTPSLSPPSPLLLIPHSIRSTAVVHRTDGTIRLLCKGAPEYVLSCCSKYFCNEAQRALPLSAETRHRLDRLLATMTERSLRTLCLAHRDFKHMGELSVGWETNPPDDSELTCDGIVGIMDPLREDVKAAVTTAQRAGIMVYQYINIDSISLIDYTYNHVYCT